MAQYVKICISLLFLSVSAFGQFDGGFAFKGPNYGASVDLDGSTEYMSKASPSNLDLNGAEMIAKWADRNFSSKDSLTWAGSGTHTIDTSSTDKRTGSYSGKLVATAAGDSTTNYIILPATSFTALEVGKKYTLEGWVRVATTGTKITAGCGTRWKQSGTLSTTTGTFTKFIFNFQATAAEVNQGIRLYVNQSDSLYLDDFSISQAMDLMICTWIKPSASSAYASIISKNPWANTTNYQMFLINNSSGNPYVRLADDASGVINANTSTNTRDGAWHLLVATINRIGNMSIYDNSTQSTPTAVSGVGKVTISGVYLANGINNFLGFLGHTQIVRFNDIATATISPSAWYVQGLPSSYATGTIVFEFNPKDGSSDANMLKDYSASGNNLSGTNVTTADRVPANYPIR